MQHKRNFGIAWYEFECGAQRIFLVVVDRDEAEQAAIDLARGRAMRMRVVPVESRAIAHGECVGERLAWFDQHLAVAVVRGVDGEAMPMRDRRFAHAIGHVDTKVIVAPHGEDRVYAFASRNVGDKGKSRAFAGALHCAQVE